MFNDINTDGLKLLQDAAVTVSNYKLAKQIKEEIENRNKWCQGCFTYKTCDSVTKGIQIEEIKLENSPVYLWEQLFEKEGRYFGAISDGVKATVSIYNLKDKSWCGMLTGPSRNDNNGTSYAAMTHYQDEPYAIQRQAFVKQYLKFLMDNNIPIYLFNNRKELFSWMEV